VDVFSDNLILTCFDQIPSYSVAVGRCDGVTSRMRNVYGEKGTSSAEGIADIPSAMRGGWRV